jgi:hypothetical protein
MTVDIRAILSKPANAQLFSAAFVDGYVSPAFGARSKSEIDLLVFTCLVTAKAIDPEWADLRFGARAQYHAIQGAEPCSELAIAVRKDAG